MVEQVIDKLLDVRNGRPGKPVQLTEGQIRQLCLMAKEVFLAQPNLLELEAPIKICGESVNTLRLLKIAVPSLLLQDAVKCCSNCRVVLQGISMGSIQICYGYLSMEDSRQRQITSS